MRTVKPYHKFKLKSECPLPPKSSSHIAWRLRLNQCLSYCTWIYSRDSILRFFRFDKALPNDLYTGRRAMPFQDTSFHSYFPFFSLSSFFFFRMFFFLSFFLLCYSLFLSFLLFFLIFFLFDPSIRQDRIFCWETIRKSLMPSQPRYFLMTTTSS